MTMPALQLFRRLHPEAYMVMLVKSGMASIWRMHSVPDRVVELNPGLAGIRSAAAALRSESFDRAYVLPRSFRSALIPFLASIPERKGMPGHARDYMLTEVARPDANERRLHQAYEYIDLMTPEYKNDTPEDPALKVPEEASRGMLDRLSAYPRPWIVVMPGAARGPSKRWSAAHFVELGRRLVNDPGGRVLVSGTTAERALCETVAREIGDRAVTLAGSTTFEEWAALLRHSDVVVCNDSGGMHVAAALGTPVVGLFGVTDPRKTGPLGGRWRILQKSAVRHREVPRDSKIARERLAAISPDEVVEAVRQTIEKDHA